jgi:hypothetical protein
MNGQVQVGTDVGRRVRIIQKLQSALQVIQRSA